MTHRARVMLEVSIEGHVGACRQPGTIPVAHSHDTLYFSSGALTDYNLLIICLKNDLYCIFCLRK